MIGVFKSVVATSVAAIVLAGAAGGATQAQAGLVLDLTSPGAPAHCGSGCGSGETFGWAFRVDTPVTVDGIGVWASNGGSAFSTQAGLFDGAGTLLESATLSTASSTQVASADPNGVWLIERFAPITLSTGVYELGEVFGYTSPLAEIGAGYSTIPQITFVGGVSAPTGGLAAPLESFSTPIFGPTLETVAGVPEPATWAMLILGLAMIGAPARRRSSGAAVAA